MSITITNRKLIAFNFIVACVCVCIAMGVPDPFRGILLLIAFSFIVSAIMYMNDDKAGHYLNVRSSE